MQQTTQHASAAALDHHLKAGSCMGVLGADRVNKAALPHEQELQAHSSMQLAYVFYMQAAWHLACSW